MNQTGYTPEYEIYDFSTESFDYAETFARAIRLMRRCYDAKITRLSDNVVIAQNQSGDDYCNGVSD